ncbi:MAG: hypothetical protein JNJ70_04525 [Verrucomicrobiales bacterium]|nr:hypothetical protein [Verrucomicrobiales bacterium]
MAGERKERDSFDSFHSWFRFFRCLREGMRFNADELGFPQIRFASAEGSEAEIDAEGSKLAQFISTRMEANVSRMFREWRAHRIHSFHRSDGFVRFVGFVVSIFFDAIETE